jgi:hypothetical protein
MSKLPKQFEVLNYFVNDWALDSEQARFEKRTTGKLDEIKVFYESIIKMMPDIMEYLKDKEVDPSEQADKNLLKLALSCVEVSRIFEVWDQQDVRSDYLDPKRITCAGYEGSKQLRGV